MASLRRARNKLRIAALLAMTWVAALAMPSAVAQQTPQIPGFTLASQPRVPVLLVPGWGDDESQLAALAERFQRAGWPAAHIRTMSFDDPVGSNREHARELALAVLDLKTSSGAERIDVVAHSMGGLAARYFLQNGGDVHVRRVVFLATPHRGTVSAFFAWGEGAEEMQPGNPFLLGLMRAPVLPQGVHAITIRTPVDFHILPHDNGVIPGIPDLRVCCPTHAGLLDDQATFDLIERFLKGADG